MSLNSGDKSGSRVREAGLTTLKLNTDRGAKSEGWLPAVLRDEDGGGEAATSSSPRRSLSPEWAGESLTSGVEGNVEGGGFEGKRLEASFSKTERSSNTSKPKAA